MRIKALAFALVFGVAMPAFAQTVPTALPIPPGEEEVDPYVVSNDNAGTRPFEGKEMFEAFHGHEGIGRIVDDLVERVQVDRRTTEIFHASDFVRLRRKIGRAHV